MINNKIVSFIMIRLVGWNLRHGTPLRSSHRRSFQCYLNKAQLLQNELQSDWKRYIKPGKEPQPSDLQACSPEERHQFIKKVQSMLLYQGAGNLLKDIYFDKTEHNSHIILVLSNHFRKINRNSHESAYIHDILQLIDTDRRAKNDHGTDFVPQAVYTKFDEFVKLSN